MQRSSQSTRSRVYWRSWANGVSGEYIGSEFESHYRDVLGQARVRFDFDPADERILLVVRPYTGEDIGQILLYSRELRQEDIDQLPSEVRASERGIISSKLRTVLNMSADRQLGTEHIYIAHMAREIDPAEREGVEYILGSGDYVHFEFRAGKLIGMPTPRGDIFVVENVFPTDPIEIVVDKALEQMRMEYRSGNGSTGDK